MTTQICIINGPNLNLLGSRQTDIYGTNTLQDLQKNCTELASTLGIKVTFFQSNHEGELIDTIHDCRNNSAAIIINPGAFAHTSVAILDALNTFDGRVIEVHISNIHRREKFRHHSYVSLRADGVVVGCGVQGYELAIDHLARIL